MTLEKARLRARLTAARRHRSSDVASACGPAVAHRLLTLCAGVARVAAYVPVGQEPPHGDFLEAAMRAGIEVLLPVLQPDLDLDWARYGGPASLAPGGVRPRLAEPTTPRLGPSAIGSASLVVVPALAVTSDGRRLGYGGGSYDRALARLTAADGRRSVTVVAVVWEDEVLDVVPCDSHDQPVDVVVTPRRTLSTRGPRQSCRDS